MKEYGPSGQEISATAVSLQNLNLRERPLGGRVGGN